MLSGRVRVHGAKNAVLPILAATILCTDHCTLFDCPPLRDVQATIEILHNLGCRAEFRGETLEVDTSTISECVIADHLMRELRSSIIFLGALASKMGRARLGFPGGCELGNRPIDLHLKALRELGYQISEDNGYIEAVAQDLHAANIHLSFPSVGATENILLAAVNIRGETTISNAAKEPEIVDLASFLRKMGADIRGDGTEHIQINGVPSLRPASYRVMPDRIVAATYMGAAMITKSEIELENVKMHQMEAVVSTLRDCGAKIEFFGDKAYIRAPQVIRPIPMLKTQVYPGFPTDAQSILMAVLAYANGTSVMIETIFDNRFKIIPELRKMGGNLVSDGRVAVICGGKLHSASVRAMDLRGGAALTIAALGASGESHIDGVALIERGYASFPEGLREIGANITKREI